MSPHENPRLTGVSTLFSIVFVLTFFVVLASGQSESSESLTIDQRIQQMQAEIKLLEKQKALGEAQMRSKNSRSGGGGAAPKKQEAKALDDGENGEGDSGIVSTSTKTSPEITALSYQALDNLASEMGKSMESTFSKYDSVVMYNEDDFKILPQYRIYRNEAQKVLAGYRAFLASVQEDVNVAGQKGDSGVKGNIFSTVTGVIDSIAGLSTRTTSMANQIGTLIGTFRGSSKYITTPTGIEDSVLGALLADEVVKRNRNIKVYFPQGFVPNYDLASEKKGSIVDVVVGLGEVKSEIDSFLKQSDQFRGLDDSNSGAKIASDAFAKEAADKRVRQARVLQLATTTMIEIRKQVEALLEPVFPKMISGASGSGAEANADVSLNTLEQFIRADKLDRFLRSGDSAKDIGIPENKIGVIKFRILDSGGTIKESKNIVFGNKVSYSGMAVIQVQVFDVDGTLRESRVFSVHSGFKKLKPGQPQ